MRGLQAWWYIRTNIATLGALLMVLAILLLLAILAYTGRNSITGICVMNDKEFMVVMVGLLVFAAIVEMVVMLY